MVVKRIYDRESINCITALGEKRIEKILAGDWLLLGLFAEGDELLSIAVIEQATAEKIIVRYIFTDPEYRELGYAGLLLEHIEKLAEECRAAKVIIEYRGPSGSYEESEQIFSDLGYSASSEKGNIIVVKEFPEKTPVFSDKEIESQFEYVKYEKHMLGELIREDKNIKHFTENNNIFENHKGQFIYRRNSVIHGVIFIGERETDKLKIDGIYINKSLSQKEILLSFLVLLMKLRKPVMESGLKLEITSMSLVVTDLLKKIFKQIEVEEDHGYFAKILTER